MTQYTGMYIDGVDVMHLTVFKAYNPSTDDKTKFTCAT